MGFLLGIPDQRIVALPLRFAPTASAPAGHRTAPGEGRPTADRQEDHSGRPGTGPPDRAWTVRNARRRLTDPARLPGPTAHPVGVLATSESLPQCRMQSQ